MKCNLIIKSKNVLANGTVLYQTDLLDRIFCYERGNVAIFKGDGGGGDI